MKETMPTSRHQKFPNKNVVELRPMLTTSEACRILGIHGNTLRRWSEQGVIVAYRIGPRRNRRFKREDVVALIVEATGHSQKRMHIN